MPAAGSTFTTTLQRAHMEWGNYRHTNSRGIIYGEGYLQIRSADALRLGIYNSNYTGRQDVLGINVFNCSSTDGFLNNILVKAGGCVTAGDVYAKQLHGSGDLQVFGDWYCHINANIGDVIRVTWITNTDILVERI